ncbi:hypothetical protein FJZ36_05130 [Candidatus Poribacteria bacterium]|nr:hypothetical protein [Candidatus Poribacteria bacterium]
MLSHDPAPLSECGSRHRLRSWARRHSSGRRAWRAIVALLVSLGFLASWGARAASDSFRVLTSSDQSLTLAFELGPLGTGLDSSGHATLSFPGAVYHYHSDGEESHDATSLPVAASIIAMPPDGIPSIALLSEESETLRPEELARSSDQPVLELSHSVPTTREPLLDVFVLGYSRDRYLARVEVRAVRSDGAAVRVTRRCQVRIDFASPRAAPSFATRTPPRADAFDAMHHDLLVNDAQSGRWRRIPSVPSAPALVAGDPNARVRVEVSRNGLYRVTGNDLQRIGVAIGGMSVPTIRMFAGGVEQSIDVIDDGDGVLGPSDEIIFYGQAPRPNRYTRSSAYFITWGDRPGRRPTDVDGQPRSRTPQIPVAYRAAEMFEQDRIHDNLPDVSGDNVDHYFWTGFTGGVGDVRRSDKRFDVRAPQEANFIPRLAVLRVALQGGTNLSGRQSHVMEFVVGAKAIGETRWDGPLPRFVEIEFPQDYVAAETAITMRCVDRNQTIDSAGVFDILLDWFELDYWRQFRASPGGIHISSVVFPELAPGPVQYNVRGVSGSDISVYQLGDAGLVTRVLKPSTEPDPDGGTRVTFEDIHAVPAEFFVAARSDFYRPDALRVAPDAGLLSPVNAADYLIIAHSDFIAGSQELAKFRASKGMRTKVVNVEDVYNDFGHGTPTPIAIQSFLRYALQVWGTPPTYVVLIGDGHYDYKGAELAFYQDIGQAPNLYQNFVPTFHSWSIPYGETSMDHRFVTVHGDDALPDMFIGRIPVQRASELSEIVSKIIAFETNTVAGPWQSRIVQIADDDATNPGDRIFQDSREELIKGVIPPAFDVQPIFLKVIGSSLRTKETIRKSVQDGALVVEYSGHGGRGNWADEDILRYSDVPSMVNDNRQPLIVATTCEMNFFDKPERVGDRSLGEEFMMGANRGAIATIGATRLTFAICNREFDRFLFPALLVGTDLTLGGIMTLAKIRNIKDYTSIQCLTGLEQYTLFGDPATRLPRPRFRADLVLDSVALDPGEQVRVRQGSVAEDTTGAKASTFDGQATFTVTWPNNFDASPENDLPLAQAQRPVVGGEFGDAAFTVPAGAMPGEGVLRLYARSGARSAIGGIRFSVRQSKILSVTHAPVRPTLADTDLTLVVQLANPQGAAGVGSVVVDWWNTTDYKNRTLELGHVGGLRYTNRERIALPGPGGRIRYSITVTDTNGRQITTDAVSVQMPIGPDLAIAQIGRTGFPQLYYGFDRALDKWAFRVRIANHGDERPTVSVPVVLVSSAADRNGDGILDPEATVLSQGSIGLGAWVASSETGVFEYAEVVLPLQSPLLSGVHDITVWVDPEMTTDPHDDGKMGQVREPGDRELLDNRTTKPFEVNDFFVGTTDVDAFSRDRTLVMHVPADAAPATALSIALETPPNAPRLDNPSAPFGRVALPRLANRGQTAFRVGMQSGDEEFLRDIPMELAFDEQAIVERVAQLLALPASQGDWTSIQRALHKRTVDEVISHISAYRWLEGPQAWKRLESKVVVDDAGQRQTVLHTAPAEPNRAAERGLRIKELVVDATSTPTGAWTIVFVSAQEYMMFFRPFGGSSYQQLRARGKLDQPYSEPSLALRRLVVTTAPTSSDSELVPAAPEYGDTITFETQLSRDEGVVGVNVRDVNAGDGAATIALRSNVDKQNAPYGDWLVFVTGDRQYEVRDGRGEVARYASGQLIDNGEIGRLFVLSNLGLNITVLEGSRPFRFGDVFRVRVGLVPTLRSTTRTTGIFSLLEDRDRRAPSVRLFVNNETPKVGSVIPPRPTITCLVSDQNGVDVDSFTIEVRRQDEASFTSVPRDQITVNPIPIETTSFRYRPIFYIGTYILRITVKDLAGLHASDNGNPYVDFVFSVDENPDLDPPKLALAASAGPVHDGDVLDYSPKQFSISMTDSHALDLSTLNIALVPSGQERIPFTAADFAIEFDRTQPDRARVLLPADLPNGSYDLYVDIADTSTNVASLGPDPKTPVRFTIDEPVRLIGTVLPAPNPIRDDTYFTYSLNQPANDVSIRIYSVSGRLVRIIESASARRGYNETYWDGRDSGGKRLANGTYFFRMRVESEGGREDRTGKMAILR